MDNWTTRKKRDSSHGKGRYEQLVEELPISSTTVSQKFVKLMPLIALFLVGLGLIAFHHLFNSHLNNKSTSSVSAELPSYLRSQDNVKFIGTAIAHGVRIMLSMAVGITFAQLFWDKIRSSSHSIQEIDALLKCGDSPFHLSSFRAATTSIAIFLVSAIASAMALLVIITPGSLSLSSNFPRSRTCSIPTIPPIMDSFFFDHGLALEVSTLGILTSDSYLPPFRVDRDSICGLGASTCTYNVSFVAPALSCVDISNDTDFSQMLKPEDSPPAAPFLIWNTSVPRFNPGDAVNMIILTQDLVKGSMQAINCTAYNATYDVGVQLGVDGTSVEVWNTSRHSVVVSGNTFASAYANDALGALAGTVFAGSNGYTDASGIGQGQINAFFVTTPQGNHTWSEDVLRYPVSYMQNASISLLSGNVNYNVSNETATNLQFINTTCTSTYTVYVYDSVRLLATYGVGLVLTALITTYGCWLIVRNGRQEKVLFSNIVRMALNERLLRTSGTLHAKSRVILADDSIVSGILVPISSIDELRDGGRSLLLKDGDYESMERISITRISSAKRCAYGIWSMTFTTLMALLTVALHHFYYHYLNGRSPTGTRFGLNSVCITGCSNELRNQAVVSDIGIALAYVTQTLLAVVIAIASMQMFWKRLRARVITIAQIDALMNVRVNPFSTSLPKALRASRSILLLSFLAFSMSLLSVVVPVAIKISDDFSRSLGCVVQIPQKLSEVFVFNNTQLNSSFLSYSTPITTVLSSGSYLPPINPCSNALSDGPTQCSYNVEFVAPGFECKDVTLSSNKSAFITPYQSQNISNTNLFSAVEATQGEELEFEVSVQSYDLKNQDYQAVNCTGVLRQYSALVVHNVTSTIDVFESHTVSTIRANSSEPDTSTFPSTFIDDVISSLTFLEIAMVGGPNGGIAMTPVMLGNIGTFQLDGNMTWRDNMTIALEDFAQNASLSLLSGRIFSFNPEGPSLLENTTTTCTYKYSAYTYTPYRLFLPYGLAILTTIICGLMGYLAIGRNGMEESMDFSRFLCAVLNVRMFEVRLSLASDTGVKAERSINGDLSPTARQDNLYESHN